MTGVTALSESFKFTVENLNIPLSYGIVDGRQSQFYILPG
jgi:hypothetical protein